MIFFRKSSLFRISAGLSARRGFHRAVVQSARFCLRRMDHATPVVLPDGGVCGIPDVPAEKRPWYGNGFRCVHHAAFHPACHIILSGSLCGDLLSDRRERIRRNNLDSVGWLLMGASGWFKNEGLVYFGAMAMAVIIFHPPVRYRRLFSRIAVGLVLPAVWHLGCRLAGASLDGYLPPGQFCAHQFWAATCRMLQYMFCSPWQYAFLFPMALFSLLVNRRDNGNLKTLTVFVLFGVAAFSVIFSMSAAVDFDWHLKSAERLLWVPSLLLLREIAWLGSRD